MKFLKSISLFCLIMVLIGLVFYLVSDEKYMIKRKDTHSNETSEAQKADLSVSTKQNVTTCDTIYRVEVYKGRESVSLEEAIPFSFTGLNREELLDEIARYEKSPSFEDRKNGFLSIELVSFHPEKIVVKKTYEEEQEKVIYYIKAINHELVVFRSDQEEAYMPTDLTLEMLPFDVQQEIIGTKCFNDIHEVYDFLESYTS